VRLNVYAPTFRVEDLVEAAANQRCRCTLAKSSWPWPYIENADSPCHREDCDSGRETNRESVMLLKLLVVAVVGAAASKNSGRELMGEAEAVALVPRRL